MLIKEILVVGLFASFLSASEEQWYQGKVEALVKQWAPLVWLSEEEKFMPLSVEEFLNHMNIVNEAGKVLNHGKYLAMYYHSNFKKTYLVPKKPLDYLKGNASSFLYGRNPKIHPTVPVYAVITYCKPISMTDLTKNLSYSEESELLPSFQVTYWMFYPYNEGKEICFLGKVPAPLIFSKCFGHYRKLGNHIGDWEHLCMTQAKSVAQVPTYPAYIRLQGGHPVLFAAKGSHGVWSAPGEHEFIRVPRIRDKTDYGTPWKTWNSVEFHHFGRTMIQPWMSFEGKWGNPKTKCILLKKFGLCEYTEGPRGLLREHQDFYC
ncbi:hypothetical protein GWI33_007872 [Rhynchophorus ferrugineus]|uniref:Uncharacterized protein n=1 Tax=Rhynchophorus ferrugineus TaxID=354439 RepID=A0A834MCM3_RHYFE|nr:hypothetical protein GWI33_007872 [Rhynchophorus ferrugineus]